MCIRDRINTRGECKIKIKQSYRVGKNIQIVGYTHSSRTIKKVTQLKQITRNEGTHTNYRLNDNCNDNHNNYNGKHYRDYHKRRMKKPSKAVYCLLYTSRCV